MFDFVSRDKYPQNKIRRIVMADTKSYKEIKKFFANN